MQENYQLNPIGIIHAAKKGFYLEVYKQYLKALQGLTGFSHLNVFWWADKADTGEYRKTIQCAKPYQKAPAKLGIFATRSEFRPNPLALTAVFILSVDYEKGLIYVPYIDAEEGTPLIDIKPYHKSVDRIKNVLVPDWCAHWPEWYEDSAAFDWENEFTFDR
jgi:tRNA-Thr(GGU) m(6)t(6)A37 methyltransferase TsaA